MSYCPVCRYEYNPGVLICPDCNEALVEKPPPEKTAAMLPDGSWVVVGRVARETESEMAREALDSNNIPSVVLASSLGAFGQGTEFHSAPAAGEGAESVIMVPREYREEAAVILKAVFSEDIIESEDN
jgi:hypothetical protein